MKKGCGMTKVVSVADFAANAEVEIVHEGRGEVTITSSDINRPAMQFAGYFEYFSAERIQLFGHQESGYIRGLTQDVLRVRARTFFDYDVPACIVCNGDKVPVWLHEECVRTGTPLYRSHHRTSTVVQNLVSYLDDVLAPEISVHGNLVDVHNVGVLIRGESGMGKSELSLELIKRGHVLVSDDVTVLRKTSPQRLTGFAPETTRGLLEIRGLGIMDVRRVYGTATVLDRKDLQIVVDMEMWDEQRNYDRLGFDTQRETILGVSVPRYVMPVRPGRNLAVVMEATAMDYRMKRSGFDIEKEILTRFSDVF
jgi:HPr kinase/phosphorylase